MNDLARITDVAPRDGLQNEPGVIATDDKVRLIELLAATGVDEIEVTSFVSPRWVPQLGDAQDVLAGARERLPRDRRPVLSALVPNEKGFERASAIHADDFPLKIATFTAASETFSKKNTNATIAEAVDRFRSFLPRAFDLEMDVRFYISCVVACPYEGRIEPRAVRRVADQLLELAPGAALDAGRVEIDLGDTIGAAAPDDIDALLDAFEGFPREAPLVLHLHDTFGRAAACARRGVERGVRRFDGSAAGLGGCPFAGTPEDPAPGNISTESLVAALESAALRTRIDHDRLGAASDFAREIVAEARARNAS